MTTIDAKILLYYFLGDIVINYDIIIFMVSEKCSRPQYQGGVRISKTEARFVLSNFKEFLTVALCHIPESLYMNPPQLAYSIPTNLPTTPKIGPIRIKTINGRDCVHADDLYYNPLNERLYGKIGDPLCATAFPKIVDSYQKLYNKQMKDSQGVVSDIILNLQPVIYLPDGEIDGGFTRWMAIIAFATMTGIEPWLAAVPSGNTQGVIKSDYERMLELLESNITRPQTMWQRYSAFTALREAYCDAKNIPPNDPLRGTFNNKGERCATLNLLDPTDTAVIKSIAKMADLSWQSAIQMETIACNEKTLQAVLPAAEFSTWKQDIGSKRGVEFYFMKATGRSINATIVPNKFPNRNWEAILTPERLNLAAQRTREYVQLLSKLSVVVPGKTTSNFAPFPDFETSGQVPVYSHAFNTILAEVFRNDGIPCKTGKTQSTTDFDLEFEFSGPNGIEYDKAEIKFSTFHGGSTTWRGGKNSRDGAFILVAVEGMLDSVYIGVTLLDQHDWESAGQAGTKLTVGKLFARSKADNRPIHHVCGKLVAKGSNVEIQTGAL